MDALTGHTNGMLWALGFQAGRGEALESSTAAAAKPLEAGWVWTHWPLADARARNFLRHLDDLPADAAEMFESLETRVQLHHEGAWAFGVLPDVERNLGGDAIGPGRLLFALDTHRLITARTAPLRVVDDVRWRAVQGQVIATPVDAFELFVERFVEVMEVRLQRAALELDDIEDRVLRGGEPDAVQLGPLRRDLAGLRRDFVSLRSAVSRALSARDGRRVSILTEPLSLLAPDIEDLDREAASLQERARLLHEEIDTLINSATNRSMRALTVMSTLLIPPTLIVGAFGMNLGGIPMANSRLGFTVACAMCVAVVLAAYVLLRRLRLLP